MTDRSPTYCAYLLRLWRAEDGAWRASLEDPRTGERLGFADLERLFVYLMEQTGEAPRPTADPARTAPDGA